MHAAFRLTTKAGCRSICEIVSPPPCTNWTRLVPLPVLIGHVSDCQCTRAVVSTNTLAGEGEGRTLEMSLKSSISVWRREED